jgi:beta-lactamase regulating signal transducer with metallopeptidase domain
MKMSLIVFGALAATVFLRRRSAALRHWVLAAGVVSAATSPLLSPIVPVWRIPFGAPAAFISYTNTAEVRESAGNGPHARSERVPATPSPQQPAGPKSSRDARTLVPIVWAGGVAVGLTILLVGLLRLTWLALHAHRITEGRWAALAAEFSQLYGLRRPVVLLQSSHPSLLVTWGLARPKVILPATSGEWSDERARVVMSHELAHIRRGDWIVQLAAEVLRAFYWFNPLMWVACRRLRLESEHACDDEVMSHGVDGTDYATHLIELARSLSYRRHTWFPAPAMARPSSLERRVRAMLNSRLDRGPISTATRVTIFAALLAIASAVAAAQSTFVTFSGRIIDEQSRAVPSVTVGLANEARQAKYAVTTNEDGRFEFVGLPPGDYLVAAEGMGFQPIKDVLTVAGQNVRRDYTLRLGTLQETIMLRFDPNEASAQPVQVAPSVGQLHAITTKKECVPSVQGGRIVPPKKIRDAKPYYPSALRGTWTEGIVKLEARIGADGYVADVRVTGDAQPDLAQSAIAAVREWRYTETLLNCAPVEVVMNVTVNFERQR